MSVRTELFRNSCARSRSFSCHRRATFGSVPDLFHGVASARRGPCPCERKFIPRTYLLLGVKAKSIHHELRDFGVRNRDPHPACGAIRYLYGIGATCSLYVMPWRLNIFNPEVLTVSTYVVPSAAAISQSQPAGKRCPRV